MDILISFAVLFGFALFGIGVIQSANRNKRWEKARRFEPKENFASARFADSRDLSKADLYNNKGLFFGFSPDGRRKLFYQKAGHMAVICAARGGKLLTLLVSLILNLGRCRSLLIIDPKLEITPIVAMARAKCGKVSVWNPYGLWPEHLKGFPPVSLNPVTDIDPHSPNCMSDCVKLLSTFWDSNAGASDGHWLPTALELAATVLYVLVRFGKDEEKTLPVLRKVLSGANGATVFEFARYAITLPDPYCRTGLSRFAAPDAEQSKELASVISTALTQTAWLNNPAVAQDLQRPDFSVTDLKRHAGTTLCIGLPLNRMEDGKAFAMISGWTLHQCLELGSRGSRVPCVAVIDEMAQIGYTKAWLDAFGNAAGAAGMQIVAVYQDISQIIKQFGQNTWETVLQNCGVTVWFEARDNATRQKASDLAGVRQVVTESKNVSKDQRTEEPLVSEGKGVVNVPLIYPHEVGQLGPEGMIAFCEGVPAVIKGKRRPYLQVERGYGKNPYHDGRNRKR